MSLCGPVWSRVVMYGPLWSAHVWSYIVAVAYLGIEKNREMLSLDDPFS